MSRYAPGPYVSLVDQRFIALMREIRGINDSFERLITMKDNIMRTLKDMETIFNQKFSHIHQQLDDLEERILLVETQEQIEFEEKNIIAEIESLKKRFELMQLKRAKRASSQ